MDIIESIHCIAFVPVIHIVRKTNNILVMVSKNRNTLQNPSTFRKSLSHRRVELKILSGDLLQFRLVSISVKFKKKMCLFTKDVLYWNVIHYFTVITPTTIRLLPTITRMITSTTQTPTRTTHITHVHKATTHAQQQNITNVQHLSEMKTKAHPTTAKILETTTTISQKTTKIPQTQKMLQTTKVPQKPQTTAMPRTTVSIPHTTTNIHQTTTKIPAETSTKTTFTTPKGKCKYNVYVDYQQFIVSDNFSILG